MQLTVANATFGDLGSTASRKSSATIA